MSLNINRGILEEPLINNLNSIKTRRIKKLMNDYGIKTVSDFLNADIEPMFNAASVIRQLVGLQRVLNYKYKRRKIMPQDIHLDDIYYPGQENRNRNITIFEEMGFVATSGIFTKADELAAMDPENLPKMIDVIRYISIHLDDEYTSLLGEFYSNYYEKNKKDQISEVTPETINDIKRQLYELGAEIDSAQSRYKRLKKRVDELEKGMSKK